MDTLIGILTIFGETAVLEEINKREFLLEINEELNDYEKKSVGSDWRWRLPRIKCSNKSNCKKGLSGERLGSGRKYTVL